MKYFQIFLITTVISLIYCGRNIDHKYPEISEDEFVAFQNKYVLENDQAEKKYLELVVKPQNFDSNKDRKISKKEIRKALFYAVTSKNYKINKRIPEDVMIHIKNNIKLFTDNIKLDFLTYKQFSYMMRKVTLHQFLDFNLMEKIAERETQSLDETVVDL